MLFDLITLSPNDRALILSRVLPTHLAAALDPVRCSNDAPKPGLVGHIYGGGCYAWLSNRFEIPRSKPGDRLREATG